MPDAAGSKAGTLAGAGNVAWTLAGGETAGAIQLQLARLESIAGKSPI